MSPNTQKPIIEVKKMNVTYFPGKSNEVHALRDIDLEIYPGEFIIFFGPSGCGKSTLLYSISGLERNITGDIVIKGDNLRTMGEKARENFHQKTIGMVFQAYYLIPSLSVLQNVALPQMALNGGVKEREERGQQLLEQFGVGAQSNKLPTELSGGQQQRVAICRSVMNDPDIIMADEPVGNLDSKSSEEVMKLLRELNDTHKKTVVLVTHDPSHLHHAHRVFFIRDGKLIRTQVNSEEDRKKSLVTAAAENTMSAELQEWAKTLGPDAIKSPKDFSDLVRARELLTELLTGLTVHEMTQLQGLIQELLHGEGSPDKIFALLHDKREQGGFGFEKHKAERWTKQITDLVKELGRLDAAGKKAEDTVYDPLFLEAQEMRRYLVSHRHPVIRDHWKLLTIDQLIYERLARRIDADMLRRKLAQAVSKGGADMSDSSANAFAAKIEGLIRLGADEAKPQSPSVEPEHA